MASKVELKVVPHTNSLKQVIQPGDEVVIVTTGYSHSVSISRGTYLGKKNDGCSCRVQEHHTKYRHRDTGIEVDSWYNDKRLKDIPYARFEHNGARYGTPEYAAASEKYQQAQKERQAKVEAVKIEYEDFKVPYFRYTTLQRNRIFKLDTNAWELSV